MGNVLFSLSEGGLAALRAGSIASSEGVHGRMAVEAGKVARVFHDSDCGRALHDIIERRGTPTDNGGGTQC